MGGGPGVPQTAGRLGSEEPVDVCLGILGLSVGAELYRPVSPGGGPEGSDPDPAVGSIGAYFIIPGSPASPVPFGPNSSTGPDPYAFPDSIIGSADSGIYVPSGAVRDSVGSDRFGSRPIPGSSIGSDSYAFPGSPVGSADSHPHAPVRPGRATRNTPSLDQQGFDAYSP
jgi:hypothetical protein